MRTSDRVKKAIIKDLKEWTKSDTTTDDRCWKELRFNELYDQWLGYLID